MRIKFRIGGVLVNPTAKCHQCEDNLGSPEGVIEDSGDRFTHYSCVETDCEGEWYRPHRDDISRHG